MSTELRTLVLNYLLADVQLRQLHADDAFARALASVQADLQRLIEAEKPVSWGELPDHAQWVAMDADGDWWWYVEEPRLRIVVWDSRPGSPRGSFDRPPTAWWRESLQRRPAAE